MTYTRDEYGRFVFEGFKEIRISAKTAGEACDRLVELGKYFDDPKRGRNSDVTAL